MRPALCLLLLSACTRPAPSPPVPRMPEVRAVNAITLDATRASEIVALSLACVDRPFPNKPGHVYDDAGQVRPPAEVTPAFYGCFDWHSAVHGHWTLVRVLALHPELPERAAIEAKLDAHLAPAVIERELAFFRERRTSTFERPYGWSWLLRLAAELKTLEIDCRKMLCGITHALNFPDGPVFTRSLMVADLEPEQSVRLQQTGLGKGRKIGCGLFIPHKGIKPVKAEEGQQ